MQTEHILKFLSLHPSHSIRPQREQERKFTVSVSLLQFKHFDIFLTFKLVLKLLFTEMIFLNRKKPNSKIFFEKP